MRAAGCSPDATGARFARPGRRSGWSQVWRPPTSRWARALLGGRRGARRSLQDAWRHRARLSERERLRVQADLLAFDGHYTDAILTYERLLSIDGNDVAAMKSLAVLQRMIRAPGRGRGNLRVAYALDPVDWPPIRRLARYYGYRGPLPDPTRLAAVDLEAIRR